MKASGTSAGLARGDKGPVARYEVHRDREPGSRGIERQPVIEEFNALDRARISALSYALDGPTSSGERFTGTVTVMQVYWIGDRRASTEIVDVIDERVAFRLLNEVRIPRARELTVSLERIQAEVNALAHLGA
ncbi:hypothetical protein [Sphingopyxis sp. RIFCSPHIGHO2_12_FULL_65_19]|uniref:hypothetical protein n=1 Tax=Sphingopyxis sp. RIFCSPHIGHO2_12_FULL_65_19 TaxID=1802172 RepID=UPI0025DD3481|nr:hypothetical protein [Sphingopyxis sp. RIFCSPHIGHO2_12_FULL_65_19]